MSKQQKKGQNGKAFKQTTKPGWIAPILVLAVIVIALAFWWWKSKHNNESTGQALENKSSNTIIAAQKINGRWVRPDGGYVLEVKADEATGKMEALYFNPRPIHVSRSEMSMDGTNIKIFVELRDANYPGSTYDLTYKPESDQLIGVYYQAVQKQNFDVTFVRGQ